MKEKQIKALRRKARQLGLDIVEKTSGGVPPAATASAQGCRSGSGYPIVVGRRGTRAQSPSARAVALEGYGARRGEPGRKIPSVR